MRFGPAEPDLILLARRCHPLCPHAGRPDAVVITGGRIVRVGPRSRLRREATRRTRVVDLGSCVLTPGLVDSHTHFFYWALERALVINVAGMQTKDGALDRIRTEAPRKTVGDWVIADGFNYNAWGGDFPTARDLDRAVSARPVMVRSRDWHTVWLNSAGLRSVGITARTPDPKGGRILRDTRGQPTGILQEAAVAGLPNPVRDLACRRDASTLRRIDRALADAYAVAWSRGLVRVHCVDDGVALWHLQRQRHAGRLGIRFVHSIPLGAIAHAEELGLAAGLGDDWLRLGAAKIFTDGSLGSQTAYMYDAYPGRPGFHGVPVLVGEELRETVVRIARQGWPVWVHAIGDRAVHDTVAAIAAARRVEPRPLPHRIEHVQCARPTDLRRMARLGIAASVQPSHLIGDIPTADRHWPRARRNTYAFRRMLAYGVTLAAGSDVPIEQLDPRLGLFAAVCRTDLAGRPGGGWFRGQKLTVEEALRAFTVGAAASVGQGPPAGTLAPGALADLTIWRDDPLAAPPEILPHVGIAGCVVGGEVHLTE
ncbi:MAG: amidohydrolase [Phycisphaerae bacterium]|jgi:predicted amidohydrolase YtcJ